MARRRKQSSDRQVSTIVPTQVLFPLIATEAFWELNPELHTFVESKPPQYYPNYYDYGSYGHHYGANYKKSSPWGCAPRRLCVPRPCSPI